MARQKLKILCFLGSTRNEGPPYPARVGERVTLYCQQLLHERGHDVSIIDPLELDIPLLRKPQFAYRAGKAPDDLDKVAGMISEADCYVMVSPEYNHSASPALLNTLNHFPSSIFSYKPSAICTYSQGQWGGARAAVSLRPILSELGCLPVSAMVHVPAAHTVMDEDGQIAEGEDPAKWRSYFMRTLGQMEWWAGAAKAHKADVDPFDSSPVMKTDPSQRNAP